MALARKNGLINTAYAALVIALCTIFFFAVPVLSATAKKTTKKTTKPAAKATKPAAKTPATPAVKPDAKPIAFLFMPPDGTTFIETYKGSYTISDDGMRCIPEITEYKAKVTITRTADGYHVVRTPISYETKDIDEDSAHAVMDKMLRTTEIEYDVELIGCCSTVTGVGKVVEKVRNRFAERDSKYKKRMIAAGNSYIRSADSPEEAARRRQEVIETLRELEQKEIEAIFSFVDSIVASEKALWNSKYMALIGVVVKPGVVIKSGTQLSIFGMPAVGTTETTVLGLQRINGHDYARVVSKARTNKTKPERIVAEMLKMQFFPYETAVTNNFNVTQYTAEQNEECLMDPSTMLLNSSKSDLKEVLEISLDNDVVSFMTIEQHEEYSYEYLK